MSGPIVRHLPTWTIVLVAVAAIQANADTFYVNGTCGDDAWTGQSQTCIAPNGPKLTIQAGIDASVNGDTVIVADETYTGVGNKNLDYDGRLITLRSENGPAACIIDCENDGRGFGFGNGDTADAVLEGFTIRNGSAPNDFGGAIRCWGASSPTILNCVLANNEASDGGGIFVDFDGNPTVNNCTFIENVAAWSGGGIHAHDNTTVTNCTFIRNSAGGFGGGMDGPGNATGCTFIENVAGGSGGGMDVHDNTTVTNCEFIGNVANDSGGGMHSFGISTVYNCTFTNNAARYGGGGMYNSSGSSTTVTDCTFTGNSVDYYGSGGGMFADGITTLVNCVFNGNTATGGPDGGGGLFVGGSATVAECVFTGNGVEGNYGGGGMCVRGSATVTDSVFTNNTSRGWGGGGMSIRDDNATVTNCSFTGNTTESRGGGLSIWIADATITDCSFDGNTADWGGGGMFIGESNVDVTNCSVTGNGAGRGGGLFISNCCGTAPRVTNCTFSQNVAADSGGGMYCERDSRNNPVVANCILWNDIPNEIVEGNGAATTVRFSDVQAGWPGEGNIDADPLFVDPANADYRLATGSPCIDAADNTAVPPGITADLAGNPRFVDDPATPDTGVPGGAGGPAIVDMGAYEFPCDPCDMNCDGTVDAVDIEFFIDILFNAATPCGTCTGDTNGDGLIDARDIEGFINCLFP